MLRRTAPGKRLFQPSSLADPDPRSGAQKI